MKRIAPFLFLILCPAVHAQQVIDPGWLADNAAAFGGDAIRGPWVLGRSFPGHLVPALDGGLYPYRLGLDVRAESTAFVASGPVKLDLAGHAVTFDDADPVPLPGEFESDPNEAPIGWDFAGCVEARPAIYNPVAAGLVQNMLFGSNTLAWRGANSLPPALAATAGVDAANNLTLTFSGTAPAAGRQVFLSGFSAPAMAGQDPATKYVDSLMYFVASSSGRTATVSLLKGGPPIRAQSASGAGSVGPAQVIRTTAPVPLKAGYAKFKAPASRYALVGVFVAKFADGVRVAVTGAGSGVFRVPPMEAALSQNFAPSAVAAIRIDTDGLTSDIHAEADYRAHLVTVMAKRAVDAALS